MADRLRKGRLAAVGFIAALVLGGCTMQSYPDIPRNAESGGQTQAELDSALAGIDGLTVTRAAGSKPNTKGNTGYTFELVLDSTHEVADLPALVDYLVRSAWSVRDGYMPNTAVEIRLDAGPSPDDKLDIVAAAEEAGWVPVGSQAHRMTADDGGSDPEFDSGTTSVSVWLDSEKAGSDDKRGSIANRESLGDWPGSAPTLPSGVIVKK